MILLNMIGFLLRQTWLRLVFNLTMSLNTLMLGKHRLQIRLPSWPVKWSPQKSLLQSGHKCKMGKQLSAPYPLKRSAFSYPERAMSICPRCLILQLSNILLEWWWSTIPDTAYRQLERCFWKKKSRYIFLNLDNPCNSSYDRPWTAGLVWESCVGDNWRVSGECLKAVCVINLS